MPFLTLYKPLTAPLSLVMGMARTHTSFSQLKNSPDTLAKSVPMLQMAISVIALAGTAFGHPLGMLISTANDLIIELSQLTHHLNTGDHQKAVETLCNIMNNIFYLALFLQGGPGFSLASLAIQILMGLYHSHAEFRDGKYIECSGHLLMAVIRGKQMTHQISALQTKWAMESHQKEVIVNPENKADTLIKYGNNPDGLSAFHYAIKKGDKKAVQFFLANGADVNARDNGGNCKTNEREDFFGSVLAKPTATPKKSSLSSFL